MGDFRIEVNAVGGHGCEREVKDGGTVYGCRSMTCPDCITARYVADMLRAGVSVRSAKIEHWPGSTTEVVDAFDTALQPTHSVQPRVRRGSF